MILELYTAATLFIITTNCHDHREVMNSEPVAKDQVLMEIDRREAHYPECDTSISLYIGKDDFLNAA